MVDLNNNSVNKTEAPTSATKKGQIWTFWTSFEEEEETPQVPKSEHLYTEEKTQKLNRPGVFPRMKMKNLLNLLEQ